MVKIVFYSLSLDCFWFVCLAMIISFCISFAGSTARLFSLVSKGLLITNLAALVAHVRFLILWPFSGHVAYFG